MQGSDQKVAFESVTARLLARLHQGYSVTLLAYGQTGSGKTYTMFGPTGSLSEASLVEAGSTATGHSNVPKMWGIMPRTILELQRMAGMGSMFASAVEVYGSHAYDLLAHRKHLEIGSSALVKVAPMCVCVCVCVCMCVC